MAPSAKAAVVLRKKGVPAITIHSGIYYFKGKRVTNRGDTELVFKDNQKRNFADWLFIDEASMVGARMKKDIDIRGIQTVWFGDPGQLQPVKDEATGILNKPTHRLTKIHRQAEGNPIIKFAHHIREGGRLTERFPGINYVDVSGKGPNTVVREMLDRGVDRLICRTNAQRVAINMAMRKARSYPDSSIQVGEEIICLKNDYALGICNGEIFTIVEITYSGVSTTGVVMKSLDTGETTRCELYNAQFNQEKRLDDDDLDPKYILADFAYGITGHKAQGSSWRHVGVVSRGFAGQEREWNYTGVTRAEEELTIF